MSDPATSASEDRLSRLTDAQRRAVRTVDRSLLVSAAAGSGKTTVLAERCAALVCDLPADKRCRVNELLVVTFTDAAAGEMRSRVAEAIRQRLSRQPRNDYLREQLYLLDTASISTIHAFCRTLIQRWFPQARVDPQATVLSGDEAELLRHEVLDALFVELYAGEDELSLAFQQLVDDYGGGNDREITLVVLQLLDFVSSLPDPRAWLRHAGEQLDPGSPSGLIANLDALQRQRLGRELSLHLEYCRSLASTIRQCWPVAAMRADEIEEHVAQLAAWDDGLAAEGDDVWEAVAEDIRGFAFERARSKPRGLSDQDSAAFDAAKGLRDEMKKRFTRRLQESVCAFTADEYRDGLTRIAPYVHTLTRLVTEFERRYQDAKTAQAAVDFNDLQRCAFRLLSADGDPNRPSEVARQLQQQYRYVLVDEFQDIDPLQEGILRLVSRETAEPPQRGPKPQPNDRQETPADRRILVKKTRNSTCAAQGNLFAVGDIKQSIYRFRLAEPKLFSQRADAFAAGSSVGELISLQDNFRSRGSVIDAINLIFEPLMSRSFGGSDYDEAAKLHAGAVFPSTPNPADPADAASARVFNKPAVELHLLEPITQLTRATEGDDDDQPDESLADELEGIEREAYLIARRIQQWMGDNPQQVRLHVTDKARAPGGPPITRPIEYRDVVLLLRSMPHKAGPIADVLRRMNVPVRVERDDSGMDSTEFRDVVSLLRLLDNRQQDIPLAAVLRSPLLGERFAETELLRIRLADRDAPFHAAVRHYAGAGSDKTLRERLAIVMATLDRHRDRIRRTPVADVLWSIYEESDYLGYVAGLPDGVRRREHLLRIHELARQFGHFSRQGLHRFLRFIDQMLAHDRPPQQPSAGGEDDVVRIMTIHTSKGLEFPVVILADLQKKFNLQDLGRNVLLDRECGIAMRVADPERRILYPTLLHQLAAESGRQETLSEELRVLYVALTRAREHLMLVGRVNPDHVQACRAIGQRSDDEARRLPRLQLETASTPLDWLLPAIGSAPSRLIDWHDPNDPRRDNDAALFRIYTHDRATTDRWRIPPAVETERSDALNRLADLDPLPPDEPLANTDEADSLVTTLSTQYPALELTTLPARIAVSELKRRWDAILDPDERPPTSPAPRRRPIHPARPTFVAGEPADDATQRGTVTHRFMQSVDLTRPCDAADLDRQCRELIESGRLSPEDAGLVMLDAAAWFFAADLGQHVRRNAASVRRELAFVSRIAPEHYDPLVSARDHRDLLLLRGIIDLLIEHDSHLEIVDYKTDRIDADACPARAAEYRTQLDSYATAMQEIHRRPVTHRWLVFLHARQVIDLAGDS